jgi:peroxiredoxin
MRKILSLVILSALAACAAHSTSAGGAIKPKSAFLKIGAQAPAFTAQTIDGRQVSLASYHGKTLLLLFSTTWCGPCRGETADVVRLYRQLNSPNVAFLRVDPQEDVQTVRAFAEEYGETYPIALDPKASIADSGYDVGPEAFPTAYVIDPNGIVRGVQLETYQYTNYIRAAAKGKSYVAPVSPQARAVLSKLNPSRFNFKGNETQIVAQIKVAQGTIDQAEAGAPRDMDFHPVFAEERAITNKMIAALQPVARSKAGKEELLTLELGVNFDKALGMDQGAAARQAQIAAANEARALLAMNPANLSAEDQLVTTLAIAKHSSEALQIAQAYAKRYPGLQTYGTMSWYYEYTKNVPMEAFWQGKLVQAEEKQAAAAPTDMNFESVDENARYLASLQAQTGQTRQAMQNYQLAMLWIQKIKHPTRFTQLDIQDVETGELALRLQGRTRGTAIFIEPWSGAPLPGSSPNTIKYRLVVASQPNTNVQLRAMRYASGWIPSFCSNNLCSPISRLVTVPTSGALMLEFQMVPNDPSAPRISPVTVVASGGGSSATTSLTTRYTTTGGS